MYTRFWGRASVYLFVVASLVLTAPMGCYSPSLQGLNDRIILIEKERLSQLRFSAHGSRTSSITQRVVGFGPSDSDSGDDEITLLGPLPGFRETLKRDVKRWPGELWHETKDIYTNPANIIILLGAGGASIALNQHADDANADFFEDENHFGNEMRDALSIAGHPGTHFVLAGLWYTVGVATHDDKTYEVGRTLVNALTINGLSTFLAKAVADRDGPNGEEWGFPSGHMSSTVTLATVLNESYGPLVGVPLYGLSVLVAMERLDDGEHYVSDVVFGAAMGWVIGHTVASGRRPELFGGEIAPYADPDSQTSGLAWVKTF